MLEFPPIGFIMTPYGVSIDWEASLGFGVEDLKPQKTSVFGKLPDVCAYYIYICTNTFVLSGNQGRCLPGPGGHICKRWHANDWQAAQRLDVELCEVSAGEQAEQVHLDEQLNQQMESQLYTSGQENVLAQGQNADDGMI